MPVFPAASGKPEDASGVAAKVEALEKKAAATHHIHPNYVWPSQNKAEQTEHLQSAHLHEVQDDIHWHQHNLVNKKKKTTRISALLHFYHWRVFL